MPDEEKKTDEVEETPAADVATDDVDAPVAPAGDDADATDKEVVEEGEKKKPEGEEEAAEATEEKPAEADAE